MEQPLFINQRYITDAFFQQKILVRLAMWQLTVRLVSIHFLLRRREWSVQWACIFVVNCVHFYIH